MVEIIGFGNFMNWVDFLPLDNDVQVSGIADFQACVSYSAVHIAETLIRFHTGQFWEFSERALAKLSGTTHNGNSIDNVFNTLKNTGLILARDWPELIYASYYGNVDWNTYYATIPEAIQKKAVLFDVTNRKLSPSEVADALKTAPVWTIIDVGSTNHIVMQISATQYYDSYEIRVKNFQASQPIISQYQLLLTPKKMTNALLVKKGNEWGYYIPATNEDAIIDKSLNYGYPLPTTNNGKNVDWNNVKPDIIIP